jgi:hypothetical protein
MPSALLVVLATGALAASLALLMARLEFFLVAHALAIGAAVLGVSSFAMAAWSTARHARRLPSRADRP